MRVIFGGSRHWSYPDPIEQAILKLPKGSMVVTGGANGADSLAILMARYHCYPVEIHDADWRTHGSKAGPIRNRELVKRGADRVYAFRCTGDSPGTDHLIRIAKEAGIPVRVVYEDGRIRSIAPAEVSHV